MTVNYSHLNSVKPLLPSIIDFYQTNALNISPYRGRVEGKYGAMIQNEGALITVVEGAIALAGFNNIVAAFREHESHKWSSTELRILRLLIGDSFLVQLSPVS
jgi:hypothetical protein